MAIVAATTIYLGESIPEPNPDKTINTDPGWRQIEVTELESLDSPISPAPAL
jgi:hypothetical protein